MTLLRVSLIAFVLAVPSLAFADTPKKDTKSSTSKKTEATKGSGSTDKVAPKNDEKGTEKKFVSSLNQ